MHVIVATGLNTGAAEYRNMGDVAMLQVAVARLLNLWPSARIDVLTESPADLARYCPGAEPLPRAGCNCWVGDRFLLGRLHQFLPKWASVRLDSLKRAIARHCPALLALMIRLRLSFRDGNSQRSDFEAFLEALKRTDLLILCGAGGFADSCQEWNFSTLGAIEAAIWRGIPVAMFGQGMGPLQDPLVFSRARRILPKVSLITLRGGRGGMSLLESLGVAPAEVPTTGDEAIELSYQARADELGTAVGINLRVASYADVKTDAIERTAPVLQAFARLHKVPLLPVPVAFHDCANDRQTIRQLLAGFDDESDGGLSLDTPLLLIKQTARCRIVVTGAYHAAVFALAQGIPVVCVINSPYYLAKFQGLEDLFNPGCANVSLSDPQFSSKLTAAMQTAWDSAEAVRLSLIQSALRQIQAGRKAYQRLPELVNPEAGHTRTLTADMP